jgi:hypothetical protein
MYDTGTFLSTLYLAAYYLVVNQSVSTIPLGQVAL